MKLKYSIGLAALALAGLFTGQTLAAPIRTELRQTDGNWQMIRDGQPYFILGAGGGGPKEFLKQCGGNSFRTWGIDKETDQKLDEAHKLGLSVALGIWMPHERHGFSYADKAQVEANYEKAKAAVRKYKDHPAVLIWSVGNEMEGFGDGGKREVWDAVQQIAAFIKQEDPNHPVMTVMAEIGGKRVQSVHQFCPDVDIVGLNTYAGGPSIARRYRAAGGKKPFVLTEFGPPGTWESRRNEWKVPLELPSTAKADAYRRTYTESILAEKDKLCLGGYAFTWGNKQEATSTWYGLFLTSGERLEAVDTMSELWTGRKPGNRCPRVEPLKVFAATRVKPGETIRVSLAVTDPENDPLRIDWRLQKDLALYGGGGDAQPVPPSFPDAIQKNGEREVELKMPANGGGYWLYAFIYDDHNGAAVVNIPLYVDAPTKPAGQ